MKEIWILGATGRTGLSVATALAARQFPLVLVGRDAARLGELAAKIGGETRTVVAASVPAIVEAISRATPGVVFNTVGPFSKTALPIAQACPPGTHYADVSNELESFTDLLALHDASVAADRCVVSGAGFGVMGTESVVLHLCQGRPPAERVRVDAIAMVEGDGSAVGAALAGSIVQSAALGGRRYEHGRLVRSRLGADFERLVLPDGSTVGTGGGGNGELLAAQRASGAEFVVAASSVVPSAWIVRAVLPLIGVILSWRWVGEAVTRRLATVRIPPATHRRTHTLAHARVQWSDGAVREGWLRTGDAMVFTTHVATEVVARLAQGEGRPGAYTPGALFGADLAIEAGGEFIVAPIAS